jgi:hypothetical protein
MWANDQGSTPGGQGLWARSSHAGLTCQNGPVDDRTVALDDEPKWFDHAKKA